MSKVKTIKIQNLKAISEFEATFNGCTAVITGGNNKGKSSLLRALPDRLRGIKPDVIVKHNETEGFAEWELTNGVRLVWQFDTQTKKGERLIIITQDAEGNELKGSITEDIMKRYFPETFDVDAFLQATPAKQRKILQNLCGLDFTKIDDRYQVAYQDRTFKNKKVSDAEALIKPINRTLPTVELSREEVQKEINIIDSHNEKFNRVQNDVRERKKKLPKTQTEIKRLKQLLKGAEAEEAKLTKEIADGTQWLQSDKNKLKDEQYHFELNKKLQEITDTNKLIVANNNMIAAAENLKKLKDDANQADKAVKQVIKEKDEMIAKANMPEGFGFADDGITYNGLPFTKSQLSSSSIYIAALKLANMKLGEVKMLHFDASFLDKNSLSDIEDWANKNDLQLLIERPDFEGGEIEYHLLNQTV